MEGGWERCLDEESTQATNPDNLSFYPYNSVCLYVLHEELPGIRVLIVQSQFLLHRFLYKITTLYHSSLSPSWNLEFYYLSHDTKIIIFVSKLRKNWVILFNIALMEDEPSIVDGVAYI